MNRPDWDQYGIILALAASTRADCTRRQVGAVIMDTDHRVVITGYNGAPAGMGSCMGGDCPRGKHYAKQVISGNFDDKGGYIAQKTICGGCGDVNWPMSTSSWPCEQAVEPTSSYDTGAGTCIALHAEQNAIVFADPLRLRGSTMYVTDSPCDGCTRLINGVRISRVVTADMLVSNDERITALYSLIRGWRA